MAKIVIDKLVTDGMAWDHMYGGLTLGTHSATLIRYEAENGDSIVIKGTGFVFDGTSVTGGTIRSLTARSAENYAYATISDLDLDAASVLAVVPDATSLRNDTNAGNDNIAGSSQMDVIYGGAGKDKIDAGGGDDRIWSQAANDILTGGKGADRFYFAYDKFGRDRITDFDVDQDVLILDSPDYATFRDGDDTVIKIVGMGEVRVEDVKPKELTDLNIEILV